MTVITCGNMKHQVYIEDFIISVSPAPDFSEAKITVRVKIINSSGKISDSETVRVWIEGENSLGEPIEIVLNEHLHIDSVSVNTLSTILFNPVLWTTEKPYFYKGKLELLDEEEKIIESYDFNLCVKQ